MTLRCLFLLGFLLTNAAAAQAPADPDDIVVTAQRRVERIQDVPISITAYSGERLGELDVDTYQELARFVPGFNVQEQSANNPGFVIRGITSDEGSSQDSPRVSIFYNGVDVSRSRGSYQDLFDLERVEVVKGPQSTLFGTAAAVGAVSVVSARPRAGTQSELTLRYGNLDQVEARGFVNAGSETVAARLAGSYKRRDGFVPNIAGRPGTVSAAFGLPRQRDLNGLDQLGLRGSVRWRPDTALTADIVVTYDRQRNPGTAFISASLPRTGGSLDPFGPVEVAGSPFARALFGTERLGLTRDVYDVNATLAYAPGGPWSVTAIAGYRTFNSREVFDADGSQAFYLEFAERSKGWQVSQELRVNYASDTVRGFAGINVFHEQGSRDLPFSSEEGTFFGCTRALLPAFVQALVPSIPCVAPDGSVPAAELTRLFTRGAFTAIPYAANLRDTGNFDIYSAFADVTWVATPRLELTAGVRGLIESRQSGFEAALPPSRLALLAAGVPLPLLPLGDTGGRELLAEDDFHAVLPRFNTLYRATETLNLYATVAKGRRSPVLALTTETPTGPLPVLTRVPAEELWNYEGGVKYSARGVSGAISGFYQTYENFQVLVIENGLQRTRNAGSAKVYGVEAQISGRLAAGLTGFANGAWIEARIDDEPSNGVFADSRFRLQPRWQASAGFTVDHAIGGLKVFATPTLSYRDRVFFELPNRADLAQGPVALVNLRAGIGDADGRWRLSGFATNLLDRRYLLDAGNTGVSFGYPTRIPAEPALYGIELIARR